MIMNWNPKYYDVESLNKQFKSAKPFPHLILPDFFSGDLKKVKSALLKEKFYEKNSDLFQFEQSDDCKNATQPALKEFYNFFSSEEFIAVISKITGKRLNSIDMSGFIYDDSDYLLPHDDRLEGRKVAYVIQLGDDFDKSDGGALQLFQNNKIVKSYSPKFNSLTLFEVSSKSLHQVQEVLTNKKRISFAGWFHA